MTSAVVSKVTKVSPHPTSENPLDLIEVDGQTKINIANRASSDRPRYNVGDYVVVLEENLLLPEALLKSMDLWDYEKNKGKLSGNKLGNRTKARTINGMKSGIALYRIDSIDRSTIDEETGDVVTYKQLILRYNGEEIDVKANENVMNHLEIQIYNPKHK